MTRGRCGSPRRSGSEPSGIRQPLQRKKGQRSRSTQPASSGATCEACTPSRGLSDTPCGRPAAPDCSPGSSSCTWRSLPRSTRSAGCAVSSCSRSRRLRSVWAMRSAACWATTCAINTQSASPCSPCCSRLSRASRRHSGTASGPRAARAGAGLTAQLVQAVLRRARAAGGTGERAGVGLRLVRDHAADALGAGGALGIILPLNPQIGFSVCAVMLLWTVVMAARQRRIGAGAAWRVRCSTSWDPHRPTGGPGGASWLTSLASTWRCVTPSVTSWTDIHDYDGVADFRSFIASASPVFLNTWPVRSKQALNRPRGHW